MLFTHGLFPLAISLGPILVAAQHAAWLNTSLAPEVRLQSFLAQLNSTQKLSMVQGDAEV
jgi:hypothetical protein